jgi:hypothetical protein
LYGRAYGAQYRAVQTKEQTQMARHITSDAVPIVEHRGKLIKYVDPQWTCDELGLTNPSLAALKAAIDRADKRERSLGVEALVLDKGYWGGDAATVHRCTVNVLATDGRYAFVSYKNRKGDARTREKVSHDSLVPLELEAEARAWCDMQNAAKKAADDAEKALKKIRKHTDASLRELADKIKSAAA